MADQRIGKRVHTSSGPGKILQILPDTTFGVRVTIQLETGEKPLDFLGPGAQKLLEQLDRANVPVAPTDVADPRSPLEKIAEFFRAELGMRLGSTESKFMILEYALGLIETFVSDAEAIRSAAGDLQIEVDRRLEAIRTTLGRLLLVTLLNLADLVKLIRLTGHNQLAVSAHHFDQTLETWNQNLARIDAPEVLDSIRIGRDKDWGIDFPISLPILWQLVQRGSIKDLVWYHSAPERTVLAAAGIDLAYLYNFNDWRMIADLANKLSAIRSLQVILDERCRATLGISLARYLESEDTQRIWADEVADLLHTVLIKRRSQLALQPGTASEIDGWLAVLTPVDDNGFRWRLSPRDLTELRSGNEAGDCTATRSNQLPGVAQNFWTLVSWISHSGHFQLLQFAGRRFCAKYSFALCRTSQGDWVLDIHATEISAKATAGAKAFKSEGFRRKILQSGLGRLAALAQRAGVNQVFVNPESNTDWVVDIYERSFLPQFPPVAMELIGRTAPIERLVESLSVPPTSAPIECRSHWDVNILIQGFRWRQIGEDESTDGVSIPISPLIAPLVTDDQLDLAIDQRLPELTIPDPRERTSLIGMIRGQIGPAMRERGSLHVLEQLTTLVDRFARDFAAGSHRSVIADVMSDYVMPAIERRLCERLRLGSISDEVSDYLVLDPDEITPELAEQIRQQLARCPGSPAWSDTLAFLNQAQTLRITLVGVICDYTDYTIDSAALQTKLTAYPELDLPIGDIITQLDAHLAAYWSRRAREILK